MMRVTKLQFGALFFTFVFSTPLAFMIGPLAHRTGYDGWMCILLGALAGTGLAAANVSFALKRPDDYIGLYGHQLMGRPMHTLLMLIFAAYCLHLDSYILREFLDFFSQTYLRETPEWAIALFLLIALISLTRIGGPAVFRFAQGCFWLIALLFLIKPLFFLRHLDSQALYAFLHVHEGGAIWPDTFRVIPWYGEMFVVMLFVPELMSPAATKRLLWLASLSGTYILVAEYILMILFFGPELSGILTYPALELASFIQLGDFLQNLDPLIVSIWFLAYFIKLAVLFYAGVLAFSHALSVREHRLLTMPLGVVVAAMALILARNPVELSEFFDRSWGSLALLVQLLPLLYPLAAWLRARRGRRATVASR